MPKMLKLTVGAFEQVYSYVDIGVAWPLTNVRIFVTAGAGSEGISTSHKCCCTDTGVSSVLVPRPAGLAFWKELHPSGRDGPHTSKVVVVVGGGGAVLVVASIFHPIQLSG